MTEPGIESPWVGILLDISEERVIMEKTRPQGQRWYGEGNRDDLPDRHNPTYQAMLEMQERLFEKYSDSWSRLLTYVCNNAVFSPDAEMLRDNLIDLAAVCTAWIEDLDRRAGNASRT